MHNRKSSQRWRLLLGALMLIAAPAMVFLLARYWVAPAWLASAIAAVITAAAIGLIARTLPLQRNDRA